VQPTKLWWMKAVAKSPLEMQRFRPCMGDEKSITRKVFIYCVRDGQLLVCRHLDLPPDEVGIQVPGGSIRKGEGARAAALREIREETGFDAFQIIGSLGCAAYDVSPYRNEIQRRMFFLARPLASLPARWEAAELHDGAAPPTWLEFFWIDIARAHVLQSAQSLFVWKLASTYKGETKFKN